MIEGVAKGVELRSGELVNEDVRDDLKEVEIVLLLLVQVIKRVVHKVHHIKRRVVVLRQLL